MAVNNCRERRSYRSRSDFLRSVFCLLRLQLLSGNILAKHVLYLMKCLYLTVSPIGAAVAYFYGQPIYIAVNKEYIKIRRISTLLAILSDFLLKLVNDSRSYGRTNGMVSVFLFDSICLITKFFPCMRVYCT